MEQKLIQVMRPSRLIFQTFASFCRIAIYIFATIGASRIVSWIRINGKFFVIQVLNLQFAAMTTIFHFQFTWSQTNRFESELSVVYQSLEHLSNITKMMLVVCLQTPQTSSKMNRNERITFLIHFQFKLVPLFFFNSDEKNVFFSSFIFSFGFICRCKWNWNEWQNA